MNVTYFDPLSRAWKRMTTALFKPFDITKWFVVGFTAFLARLMDWPDGGNDHESRGHFDMDEFIHLPDTIREWIIDNPDWFTLIVIGIILLVAFLVFLTWLSSRGKFMFLDNVVHDRAKVVDPWRKYKMEGNSLFVWRVCYGLICFVVFSLIAYQSFLIVEDIYYDGFSVGEHLLRIIGMGLLFLAVIVALAYISLFLSDFIVPIMYKNNIVATKGWSHFTPLLSRNWLYFILYGLFVLVLYILVAIVVVLVGLFTCCIGFILLIIPYIGSVITLPISYTFRAFSVEFLGQFGPEYSLFPKPEDSVVEE